MSLSLKTTKKYIIQLQKWCIPQNVFKLGSFLQLVPKVSSSKITQYGLAKMHRLSVIFFAFSHSPIYKFAETHTVFCKA